MGPIAYPSASHAPTNPNTIPSLFLSSPNFKSEFCNPEFKNVAPKKYIIIAIVNMLILLTIDNVAKESIININDIISNNLSPILFVTTPNGICIKAFAKP